MMDGSRYSGGCFGDEISYGMSKVERIMLKFRPIAPKPVAAGSGSSCSTVDHGNGGNRRRKRRCVRDNGNRKKKATNTNKQSSALSLRRGSKISGVRDTMLTLSLMPETPDRKENSPPATSCRPNEKRNLSPVNLLRFNNYQHSTDDHAVVISSPQPQTFVNSVVTVECVTETGDGLGFTDQEKVMNMEMDTCPWFITDSRDKVVWTNKGYREMTTTDGGSDKTVFVVVNKFNRVTMPVAHSAFTCTVKVAWGAASVTAPCDVWRLGTGGYAWRLDVIAALCLGRQV